MKISSLLFVPLACSLLLYETTRVCAYEPGDANRKILRVGAGVSFPPYQFVENGNPTGFDVELARAVGKELGCTVVVKAEFLDKVVQDLAAGNIDIIAGMTDLPERHSKFEYSVPICAVSFSIFTKRNSGIRSFADLRGKTLSLQRGSAMADYMLTGTIPVEIRFVKEDLDQLQLVETGECDATLMYRNLGNYFLSKNRYSDIAILNDQIQAREHCFVARKGRTELIQQIDIALSSLKSNGEYRRIYNSWFGVYEQPLSDEAIYWIRIGIGIFLMMFLVSLVFVYLLRRQVSLRTEALRKSEEKYRFIVENSSNLVFAQNPDGIITFISDQCETISGYPPSEFLGRGMTEHIHADDRNRVKRVISGVRAGDPAEELEYRFVDRNGNIRWLSHSANPVKDKKGKIVSIQSTVRNITDRKLIQEALVASEERYRRLVDSIVDYIYTVRIDNGRVIATTHGRGCISVTGYACEEYDADPYLWFRMVYEEDRARVQDHNESLVKGIDVPPIEHRIYHKDGSIRWVRNSPVFHRNARGEIDSYDGLIVDITERKKAEEQMQSSLREKEALLRELYHRTKNNMQVIISMLNQQSRETKSDEVKNVFLSMENRIHSMALVHQKLYQSKNLSRINMKEYVSELASLIIGSYRDLAGRISLSVEADDINVVIDVAIPCGMILNELITNSVKHAFPDGRTGKISVRFRRGSNGMVRLEVSDNGVGSPGFTADDIRSGMGLKTIMALGERQMGGHVTIKTQSGFSCIVEFDDAKYDARV